MRTRTVALDDSIADGVQEIKRGKRANGALERANFMKKGAFRPKSAQRGACPGRARRAKMEGKSGKKYPKYNGTFIAFSKKYVPLMGLGEIPTKTFGQGCISSAF